jgi:hypothetical protein
MNILKDVVKFYREGGSDKHKILYEYFESKAKEIKLLDEQFLACEGFGELAFSYHWYLLIKSLHTNAKFLEIGVYKGRVIALINKLSDFFEKDMTVYGLTPLDTSGDKYSGYEDVDYLDQIKSTFKKSGIHPSRVNIIKGLSQDKDVIADAKQRGPYDIIFIDGSHDYEDVCSDLDNYYPLLKRGGCLVMDDASLYVKGAFGQFLGHEDVAKAIRDKIDESEKMKLTHLYAVGHNRVWMKMTTSAYVPFNKRRNFDKGMADALAYK